MKHDPVEHPDYYRIEGLKECIEYIEPMSFCQGSAFKYCYRAGGKGPAIVDFRKALKYVKILMAKRQVNLISSPPELVDYPILDAIHKGLYHCAKDLIRREIIALGESP